MNQHDEFDGKGFPAETPLPSWYTLFFGCFGSDAGSRTWSKRGIWAAVFPAVGFAARFGLAGLVPEIVLDSVWSLSFAAAIGFVYWTTWRYMQDLDELHRRIMLEAFAFSFFLTMTLIVGVGIFSQANNSAFDVLWAYVAAEAFRSVGLVIAGRRYR